jgi:uncharacterized sulfatase
MLPIENKNKMNTIIQRCISLFVTILLIFNGARAFSGSSIGDINNDRAEEPPNIVVFVADDLGANDIGPYGNRVVRTPNLDRLADDGILFSEAFASSPTCSPSRASLHTGMMPFRNGAHANHTGIKQGVKTLPSYMKELGYRVALAGKYHIGPKESYPYELIHKTNVPEPGHMGDGVLWTNLNMSPVDGWLSKAASQEDPFMLVVNDHSPHVIWPEEAEYRPSEIDIPSRHIDTEETRKARARYYTDITKMDSNVGKLLASLDKHGLQENTVVIFTSDQGPQWAFGKWNVYDYGLKVPLIVRWPSVVKGGTDSDALVSLVDLLPTMVDMAGGTPPSKPEQIDGTSFLPVLLNQSDEHRQMVYGSHTGDGTMNRSPMRMLRTKRYKYILNLAPDIRYKTHMDQAKDHDGGRTYWPSWVERSYTSEHAASILWRYHNRPDEELYDIMNDPKETNNLAEDPHYKELLEKFRDHMDQWRNQQGDQESGPYEPPEHNGGGPVTPYIFQ